MNKMREIPAPPAPDRVRYGRIYAHAIRFDAAIDHILRRIDSKAGGFVVTPNVDHVCLAETDDALVRAYDDAFLSLADGTPLVWIAKLLRLPLEEKVSGSDLVEPLLERGGQRGLRVYFLGASEKVNAKCKQILEAKYPGLRVVGYSSPMIDNKAPDPSIVAQIIEAKPQLVFVALGCPKQELWMHRFSPQLVGIVSLGIGATLHFIAGETPRAPRWMSKIGLEWLYRLFREPKRLAHRYLVRDRAIAGIFLRMALQRRRA
jgi:N-acetylglucosaminyldiphosphoundecaprenol N-acetyl-beta-D-mannosaminyltransferase